MLRTAARRARPGFTLVELMVAAAVCVLIMAILATAFQMGIDTMRQMKSTGDMMDQLRGATTSLRADLKAKHLLDANGGEVKLSDLRWDKLQVTDNGTMANPRYTLTGWQAPENGFFRIGASATDGTTNVYEQADADGLASARFTNHYLHFTAVLGGLTDDDYYAATVRGTTYRSIAAEIAYFLEPTPTGTVNGTAATPTNLFRLIRRQRLVAVNDTDRRDRPWPPQPHDHAVISFRRQDATTAYLSTLAELTDPKHRLGGTHLVAGVPTGPGYAPQAGPFDDALAPMATRPGEDTLLSNVISFEVQVVYAYPTDARLPVVAGYPRRFGNSGTTATETSESPYDTFPPAASYPATGRNTVVAAGTYDSWSGRSPYGNWTTDINQTNGTVNSSANVPPVLARVQAVQIRIRIWDPKYQAARQVTIVQDL